MKNLRKLISMLLVVVMVFSMTGTAFAQSTEIHNQHVYNGYTIKTIENDSNATKVMYTSEEGAKYIMALDKNTRKMSLSISGASKIRGASSAADGVYSVCVDEANPATNHISGISLVSSEGKEYDLSKNTQARFVWAIPVGISLGEALIAVLLAASSALVINDVAYIVAEEAAPAIKNQNNYKYYDAALVRDHVYIGNGITTSEAKTAMALNSKTIGVFAVSASYARGLCQSLGGDEYHWAHGPNSGYWDHYHCDLFKNAHCWFFNY